jgi:hypothetical protein
MPVLGQGKGQIHPEPMPSSTVINRRHSLTELSCCRGRSQPMYEAVNFRRPTCTIPEELLTAPANGKHFSGVKLIDNICNSCDSDHRWHFLPLFQCLTIGGTMKVLSKKIATIGLALGFMLSLSAGPALAASPSSVGVGAAALKTSDQPPVDSTAGIQTVTDIQIYLSCREGVIRWSATVWGSSRTTYAVNHQLSSSGWGDFGWQYDGVVSTGDQGIGSTNTFTNGSKGAGYTTIRVLIGGIEESASINC